MNTAEMIQVLQAYAEGKTIQYQTKSSHYYDSTVRQVRDWSTHPNPKFNFGLFDYRVKPEPREFLLVPFREGCDSDDGYLYGLKPVGAVGFKGTIRVREIL